MLDSMDRWLARTMAGATALDRRALARFADALSHRVLPAVDRAVDVGRRLLALNRRDKS